MPYLFTINTVQHLNTLDAFYLAFFTDALKIMNDTCKIKLLQACILFDNKTVEQEFVFREVPGDSDASEPAPKVPKQQSRHRHIERSKRRRLLKHNRSASTSDSAQ